MELIFELVVIIVCELFWDLVVCRFGRLGEGGGILFVF